MFKLFERDKCKSVSLDTSTTLDNVSGANLADVAPGMMLYDGANGAVPAANTTGGPYSVTEINAGRFYISNDFFDNVNKARITNTTDPIVLPTNVPSGMVAGMPVLEKFDAVIPLSKTLAKGDLLSYVNGEWDIAAQGEFAFAMVTESNGTYTNTPLYTKITTWMHPHVVS